MALILVVDDMAIFRDPIAAALRAAGYEAACAGDGAEALHLMRARRPDLVLLDVAMPKVDGLTLLKAVRADPQLADMPVLLLTAVSDRKYVLEAAKLGVREYLLKSRFSLQEMLERVARHLEGKPPAAAPAPHAAPAPAAPTATTATAPKPAPRPSVAAPIPWQPSMTPAPVDKGTLDQIPRLLTREQCVERVQDLLQARTLSGVVAQVISMAASPRTDVSELASLVCRDAMLSAKVLRAANSAAYASGRGVISTVAEAVRNVGCSAVRDIAASFAIYEAMPDTSPDGFNPIRCWQHCFAVATLCSSLATKLDESNAGIAYLVGLCHDLGEIVFHSHFGPEYRQLMEWQARTGRRRDELERLMLGMSHADIVSTVLRCIGLPDSIRGPIEAFQGGAGRSDSHLAMARLLRIANTYANGTLLCSSETSRVGPLSRAELQLATSMESPPAQDPQTLRNQIYSITGMLARLSRDEEGRLMVPMFPRRNLRVWLSREAIYSDFDPMHCALEGLSEVSCGQGLPTAEQLNGIDALVVVAKSPTSAGMGEAELKRLCRSLDRPLPLLWLTGRTEGAADPTFRPIPWPVPLCQLDQFLQQAQASARSGPAGVAA